jgi:hypothetical protein
MNTLSKTITGRWFVSPDAYQQLGAQWRTLVNSLRKHELRAEHHLLYATLRGKDWRKGFGRITNPRKLGNGSFYGWQLLYARSRIRAAAMNDQWAKPLLDPFDNVVSLDMVKAIDALLPPCYPLTEKDFESGYPFDAYCDTYSEAGEPQ